MAIRLALGLGNAVHCGSMSQKEVAIQEILGQKVTPRPDSSVLAPDSSMLSLSLSLSMEPQLPASLPAG